MKSFRGKMTLEELVRCEKYAEKKARQFYLAAGVSPTWGADDAHDVCTTLFLGKERPWKRAKDARHRKALMLKCISGRIQDRLRIRLSDGETPMTRALSVDESPRGTFDENDDETNIESTLISDEGRQADLVCELDDPTGEPEWITMTRKEVSKVQQDTRELSRIRVCNALLRSLTKSVAQEKSRVSEAEFLDILKNFQMRFAQCFRAWRASLRFFKKAEV